MRSTIRTLRSNPMKADKKGDGVEKVSDVKPLHTKSVDLKEPQQVVNVAERVIFQCEHWAIREVL